MTLRVERGCGTCARYFLFPPAVARNKNLFGLPLTHPLLEGHGSLTYCDFFARNLNYASAIMPDHLLDQLDSKQTIAQYNKKKLTPFWVSCHQPLWPWNDLEKFLPRFRSGFDNGGDLGDQMWRTIAAKDRCGDITSDVNNNNQWSSLQSEGHDLWAFYGNGSSNSVTTCPAYVCYLGYTRQTPSIGFLEAANIWTLDANKLNGKLGLHVYCAAHWSLSHAHSNLSPTLF